VTSASGVRGSCAVGALRAGAFDGRARRREHPTNQGSALVLLEIRLSIGLCLCGVAVAGAQEPPIVKPGSLERAEAIYPLEWRRERADCDPRPSPPTWRSSRRGGGAIEVVTSGRALRESGHGRRRKRGFQPATRSGSRCDRGIRLTFHFDRGAIAPNPRVVNPTPHDGGSAHAHPPVARVARSRRAPVRPPPAHNRRRRSHRVAAKPDASPEKAGRGRRRSAIEPVEGACPSRRQPTIRSASDVPDRSQALARLPQSRLGGYLRIAPGNMLSNEAGRATRAGILGGSMRARGRNRILSMECRSARHGQSPWKRLLGQTSSS